MNDLAHRLSDYREQVTLRVLLLLNAHYAQQDRKLDLVQRSNQEVIEAISYNYNALSTKLRSLHNDKVVMENESKKADERHAEVLTTISTMRDGTLRTLVGSNLSADLSERLSHSNDLQTFRMYTPSLDDIGTKLKSLIRERHIVDVTEQVLDGLFFRSIDDRLENIQKAHEKTFEWLYGSPSSSHKPWDNFPQWLKTGSGCYWINGKAASGKSSLVKYIHQNLATKRLLHQWAASSQLVIGSCYFWRAGTPL